MNHYYKGMKQTMDDDRKEKIIEAAIEVFARQGYTNGSMHDIAKMAGVASGLIYSPKFFKNKQDLLLSIVLSFWELLNTRIKNELKRHENPIEKLRYLIVILNEELMKDKKAIYLTKVVHEALPSIYYVSDKELVPKRNEITKKNRELLDSIDSIMEEGQDKGIFDKTMPPSVMRQVLYGSFQFLIYGLFLKISKKEKEIGYEKEDIQNGMEKLIGSFLLK